MDAERNRPDRYQVRGRSSPEPAAQQLRELMRQQVEAGTPPSQVASVVVDAIRDERFYVLPHPEWVPLVRQRMEDIEHGRPPSLRSLGAVQAAASTS